MGTNWEIPAFESFESMVVCYEDAPNQCTIRPRDVEPERERTAWITAAEGSYCSLEFRS